MFRNTRVKGIDIQLILSREFVNAYNREPVEGDGFPFHEGTLLQKDIIDYLVYQQGRWIVPNNNREISLKGREA